MNIHLIRSLLFAAALAAPRQAVHAEVFSHVTGEGGVVEYDHIKDQGNGWYHEAGGTHRFKLGFKQGERYTATPKLVATFKTTKAEHFKGSSAIELKIIANEEVKKRPSGELILVAGKKLPTTAAYKVAIASVKPDDAFCPAALIPKDWYHSFAMKIDASDYSLPAGDGGALLFEQWWQGSPFHPPVSLEIFNEVKARANGWADANPNGNFALVICDDAHDAIGKSRGKAQCYNLGPVKTGAWMQWIVHVRPDPSGKNGAVGVTMNGVEKLKLDHITVGYDPAHYSGKPAPSKVIAYVDCCIYRLNGPSAQCFYFDEIKFSNTLTDAQVR